MWGSEPLLPDLLSQCHLEHYYQSHFIQLLYYLLCHFAHIYRCSKSCWMTGCFTIFSPPLSCQGLNLECQEFEVSNLPLSYKLRLTHSQKIIKNIIFSPFSHSLRSTGVGRGVGIMCTPEPGISFFLSRCTSVNWGQAPRLCGILQYHFMCINLNSGTDV